MRKKYERNYDNPLGSIADFLSNEERQTKEGVYLITHISDFINSSSSDTIIDNEKVFEELDSKLALLPAQLLHKYSRWKELWIKKEKTKHRRSSNLAAQKKCRERKLIEAEKQRTAFLGELNYFKTRNLELEQENKLLRIKMKEMSLDVERMLMNVVNEMRNKTLELDSNDLLTHKKPSQLENFSVDNEIVNKSPLIPLPLPKRVEEFTFLKMISNASRKAIDSTLRLDLIEHKLQFDLIQEILSKISPKDFRTFCDWRRTFERKSEIQRPVPISHNINEPGSVICRNPLEQHSVIENTHEIREAVKDFSSLPGASMATSGSEVPMMYKVRRAGVPDSEGSPGLELLTKGLAACVGYPGSLASGAPADSGPLRDLRHAVESEESTGSMSSCEVRPLSRAVKQRASVDVVDTTPTVLRSQSPPPFSLAPHPNYILPNPLPMPRKTELRQSGFNLELETAIVLMKKYEFLDKIATKKSKMAVLKIMQDDKFLSISQRLDQVKNYLYATNKDEYTEFCKWLKSQDNVPSEIQNSKEVEEEEIQIEDSPELVIDEDYEEEDVFNKLRRTDEGISVALSSVCNVSAQEEEELEVV